MHHLNTNKNGIRILKIILFVDNFQKAKWNWFLTKLCTKKPLLSTKNETDQLKFYHVVWVVLQLLAWKMKLASGIQILTSAIWILFALMPEGKTWICLFLLPSTMG